MTRRVDAGEADTVGHPRSMTAQRMGIGCRFGQVPLDRRPHRLDDDVVQCAHAASRSTVDPVMKYCDFK